MLFQISTTGGSSHRRDGSPSENLDYVFGPHGLTSLSERGLELQAASARTVGNRISVPAMCTKSVNACQMRKTDSTWDKTDTPGLSTKAAISAGYREELIAAAST